MTDRRHRPTREDVLHALSPVPPHPDTGPDNPDPFGHNERPSTDFIIALRIMELHGLYHGHLGRVLQRNTLRELLAELVADGSIVGRTRKEWAAMRREFPSRSAEILYASAEHTAVWDEQWARDNDNEGET